MFQLHSQLIADSYRVGELPLCELLLINDAQYPWFVLVPKREDITEIFQLNGSDRQQLMDESCLLSEAMKDVFRADKLNVAALGNVVSQLHIHHIARYRDDPAWPAPVWGKLPPRPYAEGELRERMGQIRSVLDNELTYQERAES